MPTQEVLASPATRRNRVDLEFRSLFTATFPSVVHEVDRLVGDPAAAESITRNAFLALYTRWRRVCRGEGPEAWVRRHALLEADRARVASTLEHTPDSGRSVALWEARTDDAYDAVVAASRRRRVRRNTALGGAVAVVALVVGAMVAADPESSQPGDVGQRPAVATNEGPIPRAALDGVWHTRLMTRADVAGALRRAGLAEYADYARKFPQGRFRIHLAVYGERSVLAVDGDQRDISLLRVSGHRFKLEPFPPDRGISRFQWSWDGRTMSLGFTGTRLADRDGFPAEVHQVALYTTAPFTSY